MPFPLLIGRYEPEFLVRLLPPAFTAVGTGKKQLVKTLEEKQFPQHYYPHGTPATEEAGADKEKTETSTTPVAEDAPKNKVLKEQHLVIEENQKGISFDELFGPYPERGFQTNHN